jgi:hypothetical protein
MIPLLFGLGAWEYGAALPYVLFSLLLVLQFFRPTILGWVLAMAVFGSTTVWLLIEASSFEEVSLAVLIGLAPTVVLAFARPRLLPAA